MNNEEMMAIRQRTQEAWAKFQRAAAPCNGTIQHFKNEAERQQHLREVEQAQRDGAPF